MLEARFEEMEELYLQHRDAAEWLVHGSEQYTPVALGQFASGQAALEAAWRDATIDLDEHTWLLQGYTRIVSHCVDDLSEGELGFAVEISPPLSISTEFAAIQAYLLAAEAVRAEVASQSDTLRLFYELAKFQHDCLISPCRLTATGTLLWARSRRSLSKLQARQIDVYFEAMHVFVEQHELRLPDIADWLEQELARPSDEEAPQLLPDDEWKDW